MTDEHPDLPPELTPPPDQPLSADRRQEMREHLLSAAGQGDGPGPARRPGWLIPGLAAAAVVSVIGTGVYLANANDSSTSTPLLPAGTSTSTSQPTSQAVPSPDGPPDTIQDTVVLRTTAPQGTATPPTPTVQVPPIRPTAQNCADAVNELIQQGEPELAGATVTAQRAGDRGTTYLYESKSAWVICDDFAGGDGGLPTLLAAHSKQKPYVPSAKTLQISDNTIGGPNTANWHYQYFAAGADFDGVQAISYTFPDGHTEDAVVGQNGMWSMNYQPTSGPLADPKTNYNNLGPIKVTVAYTQSGGSSNDTFTLPWGLGTCGQTNHGC